MKLSKTTIAIILSSSFSTLVAASESAELTEVKQQLTKLEQQLSDDKAKQDSAIKIGGAVRFQYSYNDYSENSKDRGGELQFDTFRINVNGEVSGLKVSAEYRFYQYMDVVHHADVAYDFNDNWEGKFGITQVPFGNLQYNSNSFFYSTGFYAGLEEDYDLGIVFKGDYEHHDIHLGFFKNDELGGVEGFASDKTARYSYDVIGVRNDYDPADFSNWDAVEDGEAMGENNTLAARYAYKFGNSEIGASVQLGDLEGKNAAGITDSVGDRTAVAVHAKTKINNFNIVFQYSNYEYDLDNGSEAVAVGAWGFTDTLPSEASLYNLNIAYNKSVSLGPITNLTFYNDYNLTTDKSGDFQEDTVMNVTGVAISAGSVYTWVDFIVAKNQPFIGGSLAGDSDQWNKRINILVGYYF